MPNDDDEIDDELEDNPLDEELLDLMENHDLDLDTAQRVREIMDEEGIDEDEAVEIEENL